MFVDWIQSVSIIVMFSIFLAVDMYTGSVQELQENWVLYRCNPLMMPFAGYFAPDGTSTEDNFGYCVQNMMTAFTPSITQPFSYLQSLTTDMIGSLADNMAASTAQSSAFSFNVSNIFGGIYTIFLNIMVEFNIIIVKLLDTQGKISGIMTTLLYIMTAVQYTFESMWAGVPGKMIKVMGKL
jgi:hypothetical protein